MFRKLAAGGISAVFVAMVAGLAMNAAGWRHAEALTNCTTSTMSLNSAEQQLLGLINAERQRNGLNALAASPNLSRAAAWMSEDQSSHGLFSHTDSLGRSAFTRIVQCGYGSTGAGENLARTSSAQGAFNLWMGSSGHRANILNPNWTVAGVGQAGSIWTVDFGSLNDSTQPWDSGPPPATSTPTSPSGGYTPPATNTPSGTATPWPTVSPTVALPTSTPTVKAPTTTPTAKPVLRRASLPLISAD